MKRATALLLAITLSLTLLAGCHTERSPHIPTGDALEDASGSTTAPEAEQSQQLSLAYYPDRSLNPYTCADYTNRCLFSLLYQGLFTVDREYTASPVLCRSYYRSRDMRTYIFYLEEAAFSDGTTVTDADVVASLLAAMESSYYSGRFGHVLSVTALETGGVEIVLDTPYENLPLLLDIPIVKASQVEAERPIGTGPYVMESSVGGMRLRRRTVWWCSAEMDISAAYIPLVKAESSNQIRDSFEYGDVSLVCADPSRDHFAEFRCDYELWERENGTFLYMVCDTDSQVFSNPTVRAALTHAIDRDYLVETYYRGFATAATLPASPYSPVYDDSLARRYGFDQEAFTAAINEAGLAGTTVTMLTNRDDALRLKVGKEIARMLTDCGLEVELIELSTEDFLVYLEWAEYDLYLAQTRLSPNMDLSRFFAAESPVNYGNLANVAAYAMSLEALANSGNYSSLHQIVMEDGQFCPILFCSDAIYTARGLLTDLSAARDSLFYYSLGKSLEEIRLEEPLA